MHTQESMYALEEVRAHKGDCVQIDLVASTCMQAWETIEEISSRFSRVGDQLLTHAPIYTWMFHTMYVHKTNGAFAWWLIN
jgi:hypothetical protein